MSDPLDFPCCPKCGMDAGFDCEVYVPIEAGSAAGTFRIHHGGIGVRCQACGEDVTEAGMIEMEHPFLLSVVSVLEYCTAYYAIEEGLSCIGSLLQEER